MIRTTTYSTRRQWKYAYGLSEQDHRDLVDQQGGRCLICGIEPATLVVDHDHRTGRVRGLLCDPCNRAIGHLQDSPGVCRRAAEYLRGSARAQGRTERTAPGEVAESG